MSYLLRSLFKDFQFLEFQFLVQNRFTGQFWDSTSDSYLICPRKKIVLFDVTRKLRLDDFRSYYIVLTWELRRNQTFHPSRIFRQKFFVDRKWQMCLFRKCCSLRWINNKYQASSFKVRLYKLDGWLQSLTGLRDFLINSIKMLSVKSQNIRYNSAK